MAFGESDSYSLHSISRESNLRPQDDSPSPSSINHMTDIVYQRYKQLEIDLYSQPCYAASSGGPLPASFDTGDFSAAYGSRFREGGNTFDWKPAFSGRKCRRLLWIILWLVLIAYCSISISANKRAGSVFTTTMPSVLSTLLAIITMTIVGAEIRREGYQIHSRTITKIMHERSLRRHRSLVVYILAPLLSVPLWTTRYASFDSSFVWLRPYGEFFTLSSWKASAQHFSASLPRTAPIPYMQQDLAASRESWGTWRIVDSEHELFSLPTGKSPIQLGPPDVLAFTHPVISNTGSLLGWGGLVSGEAAIMPVFPAKSYGAETISATIRTTLNLVSPSLRCGLLEQTKPWDANVTYDFHFENCKGDLKLESQTVDSRLRELLRRYYKDEITQTEQALDKQQSGNVAEKLKARRQVLHQDNSVLHGDQPLHIFKPQWIQLTYAGNGSSGARVCERTFFFIGDNRPFRPRDETDIPEAELSLAFCETRFSQRTARYLLRLKQLAQSASFPLHFVTQGGFSLPTDYPEGLWQAIVDWVTMPEGVGVGTAFLNMRQEETKFFSQLLADRLPPSICWHDLWPKYLLSYGRHDILTNTMFEVAALALGSKIFSSWAVEQLSETADMVLQEKVEKFLSSKAKVPGLSKTWGFLSRLQMKSGTFSSSVTFRIFIVLIACICTRLVWSSHTYSNDAPSGYPWSIDTIAAKAMLLIHSRLRLAFASSDHTPDQLRAIPGLRIGYWASKDRHPAQVWGLDSKCNQVIVDQDTLKIEKYRSPPIWQRHNLRSLAAVAHPFLILLKLSTLTTLTVIVISVNKKAELGTIKHGYLPAILSSDLSVNPGWKSVMTYMVLPQFLIYSFLSWWHDLDLFYSARQPWAGLATPRPADQNLTLDYLGGRWRLPRAMSNKHYSIVLLSFGWAVGCLLPVLAASLFRLEPRTQQIGVVSAKQNYKWATRASEQTPQSIKYDLPVSAINALVKPPGNVPWVLGNEAILPVDLQSFTSQPSSSSDIFWKAKTGSIRSQLTCAFLSNFTMHWGAVTGRTSLQPQKLNITLPTSVYFLNGTTSMQIESCGGTFGMPETPMTKLIDKRLFCSRWTLVEIRLGSRNTVIPAWIVTMVTGELDTWHPDHGPLLQPDSNIVPLLCQSHGFTSLGIAEIFENDNETNSTRRLPRSFDRHREDKLHDSITWEFSNVLKGSLYGSDSALSGLSNPQPFIEATTFVGDALGYLLYRTLLSHELSVEAITEGAVSHVYSTIFAVFVAERDWLRRYVTSTVEVSEMQWTEVFRVRKAVLSILLVLLVYFAASAVRLGKIRKEYRFPIAPEPLENSLFFLYQSSLLGELKSIPSPEQLSISGLHRRVSALRNVYTFGRYQNSQVHSEQYGVDSVAEFESNGGEFEREQIIKENERYRDSPRGSDDESESSEEGESSESDEQDDEAESSKQDSFDDHGDDSGDQPPSETGTDSDNGSSRDDKHENGDATAARASHAAKDGDEHITQSISNNAQDEVFGLQHTAYQERRPMPEFPDVSHLPELGNQTDRDVPSGRVYSPADFPSVKQLRDLVGLNSSSSGPDTRARTDTDEISLSTLARALSPNNDSNDEADVTTSPTEEGVRSPHNHDDHDSTDGTE